jgi:hypothetical protein
MNLFVYVGNNPVNRYDSAGHWWLNAIIGRIINHFVGPKVVATAFKTYCGITLSNYIHNSKVDSNSKTTTKNRIINDQNGATGDNFRYGLHNASWNACGPIAVHNAKVLKGQDSTLSGTMLDFQLAGAMIGYGYLGSNPLEIGSVLSIEGMDYSRVGLNEMTESGTYIISFLNENPLENGLHTVAVSYDGTTYSAYNLNGGKKQIELDDYSKRFICGYYLR